MLVVNWQLSKLRLAHSVEGRIYRTDVTEICVSSKDLFDRSDAVRPSGGSNWSHLSVTCHKLTEPRGSKTGVVLAIARTEFGGTCGEGQVPRAERHCKGNAAVDTGRE